VLGWGQKGGGRKTSETTMGRQGDKETAPSLRDEIEVRNGAWRDACIVRMGVRRLIVDLRSLEDRSRPLTRP